MFTQFISIGFLILLAAMMPGPDFALVTKNTLLHSRRAGIFTSLGISFGNLVHITYCVLGLALVISQSIVIFNMIKYLGAAYLIYLGINLFFKKDNTPVMIAGAKPIKNDISDFTALRQGFICNVFNPKATLFFLALFTMIIKPNTSGLLELVYAIEIFLIAFFWFASLTMILSHPRVLRVLNKIEKLIPRILGVFLIGFGIVLASL